MSPPAAPLTHPSSSRLRLLLAVPVGLAGFALDVPVHLTAGPVRVSLIFGSVLPMVLAMAWGWRAGLVASTCGLAGMFAFTAWPANGWANVATSLLICLWFVLHGWAAERRASGRSRWWHGPFAVEAAFDIVFATYLLTGFRWLLALNPAPWTSGADMAVPVPLAWLIACKSVLNSVVVMLVADTLLHLAPLRRLLGLPQGEERRYDTAIAALGLAAGLMLWSADALVMALLAPDRTWWEALAAPGPHQLLVRLALLAVCVAGALATAAFVRHRLRQDRELHERLLRNDHILRTSMDGFCLLDGAGRVIETNETYVRMSGYAADELVGMHISQLDADESRITNAQHIARIRSQGGDRFEARHRRKDGSVFDVEVGVLHRPGAEDRFYSFVRDISDRKRATAALELERTLYKDLVTALPVGVYRCIVHYADPLRPDAWDNRVEITLVSDAFCRILGLTREACLADAAAVVGRIHPDDQAEFARRNILGQTDLVPFDWEGRILRDGELRWVHFASLPRRLADGDVIWTGVLVDISERKRAEAEQQRLEEHLRQREKMDAIGQLAGGIAHDVNNQLSGVLGYADLLEARLQDPELRAHAASIRIAAGRSADLAQRLLAFARKGRHRNVPVDLHALAGEVADLLRRGIDKRIAVVLRLEAEACTVMGDPSQLQNVLLNLGLNARDAMPDGGELVIASRPGADGRIELRISDTGIGMDAETRRRLFEPFFTTKAAGKGTGLGLASADAAVKNHGGAITVESAPGRGSAFTISLPLVGVAAVAAESGEPAPLAGTGLVLVIDDEPLVRAVASDLLRFLGHRVEAFADPEAALRFYGIHGREVQAVLLDLAMPTIGGHDAFLRLRGINPDVRVVLASGCGLDGEAQAVLDAGARAFVQKPFDRQALARAIAQACAG